ncbi:MAG: hypothetical protein GEU81_03095 [Nitriliruptorales bacterium]|nr:hypothetical protein [Nitriliruptorales bacterium]
MTLLEIAFYLVAAVGAALALGTGAALWTYRRTGAFPGQQAADDEGHPAKTAVAPAVTRLALGVVLLVAGLTALASRGWPL